MNCKGWWLLLLIGCLVGFVHGHFFGWRSGRDYQKRLSKPSGN